MRIRNNLPNALTFINLSLGVTAIFYIILEDFFFAGLLILAATFADRLDGQLARKLGVTSDLGKELDSLSDLISFGLAPAILVWNIAFIQLGYLGMGVTLLFAIAGTYRLAKFNITEFDGIFTGIPITMCGGLLALTCLYAIRYDMNIYLLMGITLLLSYAMVTTKIQLKKR